MSTQISGFFYSKKFSCRILRLFTLLGYVCYSNTVRDSLKGSGIRAVAGLRKGSSSREKAKAMGFSEKRGMLGEMAILSTHRPPVDISVQGYVHENEVWIFMKRHLR